ncbi:MAG: SDR family oxidoreductase [Candidatus Nealsonbacteria bacterium]|nr:SDR family oxidoreductase [Candidatus Nealsonbacteria bacterium]
MDLGLKGKVIIVGGGHGGIGSFIGRALREEGAIVVSLDFQDGKNLADPAIVVDIFADLRKRFPQGIHGYVSSVYGGEVNAQFLDSTPQQFAEVFDHTFLAAFYPIQETVKWMKETGGGHIVVISSINSFLGLNQFAYDAAKGALNRIAPDVAVTHGQDGIYITTLCPGTVAPTPPWKGREEMLARVAETIPDRHVTHPGEIGAITAFLLSQHAQAFTGCTLIADRGWSMVGPMPGWKR